MASLPPQRPPARRASPTPQSGSSAQPQQGQQSSQSQQESESSAGQNPNTLPSDNTETAFLFSGKPPTASATQSTAPGDFNAPPLIRQQTSSNEPRRCWICFNDETEDTPTTSPWRTPCPCALTAHEQCLLDWIADMESPDSRLSVKEIRCPQCKTQIHLARPYSPVVEVLSRFTKLTHKLLLPGAVAGLTYSFLLGFSRHGESTIRMIFGEADASRILAPIQFHELNEVERDFLRAAPLIARPLLRGWRGLRVELGLPMIPAVLILARTNFADAMLPFLSMPFFLTCPEQDPADMMWPPSAAMTLVALPYVRSVYEGVMQRIWGERERQWLKEIQPQLTREEREAREAATSDNGSDASDDDEAQIEIDIDFGMNDDGSDSEDDEDGADQMVLDDQAVQEVEQILQQRAQAGAEPPPIARADGQPAQHPADGETPSTDIPAVPQDPSAANARPPQPAPQNQGPGQGQPAQLDLDYIQMRIREQEEALRNVQPPAEGQGAQAQDQGHDHHHHHHHHGHGQRQEINLVSSLSKAADTILGALIFPTLAASTGEILRLLLPRSWTTLPVPMALPWNALSQPPRRGAASAPTGLLQTQWGRGVVGGCLVVVLKDALRIYGAWRKAQVYRQRHILNYDRSKAKAKAKGESATARVEA